MFILYSLLLGLVAGFLTRGRVAGLASLRWRWPWVLILALLTQVVLFSDQVAAWIGDAGPPLYVASTAAGLLVVLANRAIAGMPVVALGAASNFAAIAANGGFMPVDPRALQTLGPVKSAAYSNSAVVPDAALAPLTDIFALPTWLPFANVFSIGDVLIGAGVAIVIALAMHGAPAPAAERDPAA